MKYVLHGKWFVTGPLLAIVIYRCNIMLRTGKDKRLKQLHVVNFEGCVYPVSSPPGKTTPASLLYYNANRN